MAELATLYTISPSNDSAFAVEVLRTGWMGRKKRHILFFENFRGELHLVANDPAKSRIQLTADASSLVCRDTWLKEKKRAAVAEFARKDALQANLHPEIRFTSTCIRAKPLRGFVVTGILQIRGISRELKVNMSFNPRRKHEFQLDGDTALRLSDFDLPRPTAMFGLMGTKDETMVHLLLWAAPLMQT